MRSYTEYLLRVKKLRSHVHIERDRGALFEFFAQLWSVKQNGPEFICLESHIKTPILKSVHP